ncbi:hypothetical protein NKI48_03055 [Mesorhizobium sp. M0644]|uniref:hypothetical protein n=1 Tax=Mesorhizobium sp. M0644 TaxID=2956979 RepID=UPI003334F953
MTAALFIAGLSLLTLAVWRLARKGPAVVFNVVAGMGAGLITAAVLMGIAP